MSFFYLFIYFIVTANIFFFKSKLGTFFHEFRIPDSMFSAAAPTRAWSGFQRSRKQLLLTLYIFEVLRKDNL